MNRNPYQPGSSQDEEQLIAFHLGEPLTAPEDEHRLRARLEYDPAFAALSDEIAHTLRVFSADPVPTSSAEAAWQRLRDTLPPLDSSSASRRVPKVSRLWQRWSLPLSAAALAGILVAFLAAFAHHRHQSTRRPDEAGVIHLRAPQNAAAPVGEADHLDRAERWLTTVNHATAPLDPVTRAEGQQLLTENATYLRDARARGDLPDAAVLDRLDRVLTTSNHPAEAGLQLRLDMNTDGLLFQVRILRQNQAAPNGDSQ